MLLKYGARNFTSFKEGIEISLELGAKCPAIISRGFIEPQFTRKDDFVTGFAVETRGLWMVQNDFMGGPFISYTFVDPTLERVITIDGYVYNPSDLKRNFIRQMEAIFHSIGFKTEGN